MKRLCRYEFLSGAFCLLFAGFSSPLCSQSVAKSIADPNTLSGIQSAGRAGATVATPGLTQDALFLNPASSAFQSNYTVSAAYKSQGDTLVASLVDGKSGPVGGALYYARRDFQDVGQLSSPGLGSTRRLEDRAGGTLFGKISEEFALGAHVSWGRFASKDPEVESFRKWNGGLGALYQISRQFSVGATARNLLKDEKGLDPTVFSGGIEARLMPGLALSVQIFRFQDLPDASQFSYPSPENKTGWSIGTEYFFRDAFGIRGGYKDNASWNEKIWTAGVSYKDTSYSIDYSFEMFQEPSSQQYHGIGVSALF